MEGGKQNPSKVARPLFLSVYKKYVLSVFAVFMDPNSPYKLLVISFCCVIFCVLGCVCSNSGGVQGELV